MREDKDRIPTKEHTLTMCEQIQRSKDIDRSLKIDSRRRKREATVLLLGDSGSAKEDIMKQLKTNSLYECTREGLEVYRYPVRQSVIRCFKELVGLIRAKGTRPESDVNDIYHDFLRDYILDPDPNVPMGGKFEEAVKALWKDPFTTEVIYSASEFYLKDSAL
jgi:hypothetical protein